MADGQAAGLHQMLIDQDRGYNSVSKEITRRSPPSENPTGEMITTIAGWLKTDPNATYNLRDRKQAAAFLSADVRRETGHTPSDADIQAALNEELGPVKKIMPRPTDPTLSAVAATLGFGGGPGRSPSGPITIPPSSTDLPLPSANENAAGAGNDGKVDVHVKISHDGSIATATTAKGRSVGKLRVETPMQPHAA